jgi:hypothetical protein
MMKEPFMGDEAKQWEEIFEVDKREQVGGDAEHQPARLKTLTALRTKDQVRDAEVEQDGADQQEQVLCAPLGVEDKRHQRQKADGASPAEQPEELEPQDAEREEDEKKSWAAKCHSGRGPFLES